MRISDKRNMARDMMNHFGSGTLITRKQILEFWNKNNKQKNYPYYSCITLNDVFTVKRGQKAITEELIVKAFPMTKQMEEKEKQESKPKIDSVTQLVNAIGINVAKKPKNQIMRIPVDNFSDDMDDGSDLVDHVRMGNIL